MAPDTTSDKPVTNEQATSSTQLTTESTLAQTHEGGNDLYLQAKVDDDLEIYEDNAEVDDLTDSDEEPIPPARHVRITISTDRRKHTDPSSDNDRDRKPRTAKMTEMKFGEEDTDGLHRKTNTPASAFTELSELKSAEPRVGSRFSGSREAMFRRAMTLMANRCISRMATPLVSLSNPPYGVYGAKYFYVTQNRPAPMPPLKVWRGYNGSVYFEPIQVQNLAASPRLFPTLPREHYSSKSRSMIPKSHMSATVSSSIHRESRLENEWRGTIPNTPTRTKSQLSSNASTKSVAGPRKMCLLDKTAVFSLFDENIHDDIVWIKNQESTGSLRIVSKDNASANPQHKFGNQKIVKGSVAHKLIEEQRLAGFVKHNPQKSGTDSKSRIISRSTARKLFSPLSSSTCHVPAISANSPDIQGTHNNEKLPLMDNGHLPHGDTMTNYNLADDSSQNAVDDDVPYNA